MSSAYLSRVAALGCMACGGLAIIHHVRSHTGLSVRPDDSQAIPLCPYHHNGAEGVHTLGTATWEAKYGSQESMVTTVAKLIRSTTAEQPKRSKRASKILPRRGHLAR